VGRRAGAEGNASHIGTTSTVFPGQLELIMKLGPLPDAMEPDIYGVSLGTLAGGRIREIIRGCAPWRAGPVVVLGLRGMMARAARDAGAFLG
jgi:hypothetical protein